jgi:hypothetical protein
VAPSPDHIGILRLTMCTSTSITLLIHTQGGTLNIYAKGGGAVTREEKKLIRLQIARLLDQCQGCRFRSVTNAGIHICPSCPIGQRMQTLGRNLCESDEKKRRIDEKKRKAVIAGIPKRRQWTTQEEEFLLQNLHMGCGELAKQLGRSYKSVHNKITDLKRRGRIHAS